MATRITTRSEVRRLRLVEFEQVRHQQHGQAWVPHWHDTWSFGAIIEGQCRCSVDGQPFFARRGDLIAIAPGVVHTGAMAASAMDGPVLAMMLYVPDAWLELTGIRRPAGNGKVRDAALTRAAAQVTDGDAAQAWLRRAIPALTRGLTAHAAGDPTPQRPPPPSEAVQNLIDRIQAAILDGERTVCGLARHCAVSRERIHRVLRQTIGMSPTEYLRAVRLHRAKSLVMRGEPVAAIAADCGFADQAHFTRWFRRTFGYTPGDLADAGDPTPANLGDDHRSR